MALRVDPIDSRPLFRPLALEFGALLARLDTDDWTRPTLAPAWRVRDVVAHLIDTMLRRVSVQRDGYQPPRPATALTTEAEFVAFINALNAGWVTASQRLSPA
ncbi:MAG: maleylpyruvate isomerase N-terminal domain-containing protein, partial [Vicinamibacterales bacterium]